MAQIPQVPEHFTEEYDTGVHIMFKDAGFLMKPMVRFKEGIRGQTKHFRRIGHVEATKGKPRHGLIPTSNPARDKVSVTAEPYYVGLYEDQKDLARLDMDDKAVLQQLGAIALGDAYDTLILDKLRAQAGTIGGLTAAQRGVYVAGAYNTDLTLSLVSNGVAAVMNKAESGLNKNEWYGMLDSVAWGIMMTYPEFSSADYVGDMPYAKATDTRVWSGIKWVKAPARKLAPNPNNLAELVLPIWNKMHVGVVGSDVPTSIWSWENTRDAWFINQSIDVGAVIIEETGIGLLKYKGDASITHEMDAA